MSRSVDLPAIPAPIAAVTATWPPLAQSKFAKLRQIILTAAAEVPTTGSLSETLKWGEPAWLTEATKSGTTLRAAWKPAYSDEIGLFVNCRTSVAETMRQLYPDAFRFDGTRGLWMGLNDPMPEQAVDHLARLTQNYHRARR